MSAHDLPAGPDLERHLSEWLKSDGPQDVPDRVVETAILEAVSVRRLRPRPNLVERLVVAVSVRVAIPGGRASARRALLPMWAAFALLAAAMLAMTLIGIGALLIVDRAPAGNGKIAFDAGGDIWLLEPQGSGRPTNLTRTPDAVETGPSWSPDGRRLAYWMTAGPASEIHVVGEEGTLELVLTAPAGLLLPPESRVFGWSPDGRSIAAPARGSLTKDGVMRVGVERIVVFDTGSGASLVLDADGDARSFGWSPDGRALGFVMDGELYLAPSDGAHPSQVDVRAGSSSQGARPRWSVRSWPSFGPDGRLVLTAIAQGDGASSTRRDGDIAAVRADGDGVPTILVGGPTNDVAPRISPDGRTLAFARSSAASADGAFEGDWDPFSTTRTARLHVRDLADPMTDPSLTPLADGVWPDPVWSPDSRRLVAKSFSWDRLVIVDVDGRRESMSLPPVNPGDWIGSYSWQPIPP